MGVGEQIPLQIRKPLRIRFVSQAKPKKAIPQTRVNQLQTAVPEDTHPHHFLSIPLHYRLIFHVGLLHIKNTHHL